VSCPRIQLERTGLLVVDVQERLLPHIHGGAAVADRCRCLISGCRELGLPIVVTEQNPGKLGSTVPTVAGALPEQAPVYDKTRFSAMIEPVRAHLQGWGRDTVLVCGIETHVCVLQSVLDLVAAGYRAAVVADAVGSRRPTDHETALVRMASAHVLTATVEMALLEMVGDARDQSFRRILPLIK